MQRVRPEHPQFDGPRWQDLVRAAGGWTAPREIRVTSKQATDEEAIVAYLASVSWIAAMPEPGRTETLARLATLVAEGETPPEMPIHVTIGLASLA
jgi:hypothetical protein